MIELNVPDMTCEHCVSAVTRAARSVDSQAEVRVDLAGRRVRVDGQGSIEAFMRALEEAGYPAAPAGTPAAAGRNRGCCAG